MQDLEGKNAVVTGGSGGLGRGVVEALVARGARVTVVARDASRLSQVGTELGVATRQGDITDAGLARSLLADVRPSALVLNAGVKPPMGRIHELSWDDFRANWEVDVKGGLFWVQEALRLPLPRGSRVVLVSSGAAMQGSPLSGGYAGAKRMLWLMAHYANGVASELGLDLRFQTVIPRQLVGGTGVGDTGAQGYAKKRGVSVEEVLAGFGKALSPRDFGEHVAAILTDSRYESGVAFGVKGDTGIVSLDD